MRLHVATTSDFIGIKLASDDLRRPNICDFPFYSMFGAESKAQLLPQGKALMLVLKQPGDDIRAAALGDLDGDQ